MTKHNKETKDSYHREQNVPVTNKSNNAPDFKPKKTKRFRPFVFLSVFVVTVLLVFSSQITVSEQGQSESWFYKLPIIRQLKHLAESADRALKGEDRDRINILLLGMGGIKHEGGYLTDTIIIASLEPKTKKTALISVPRDLALPVEDMGLQKINSIKQPVFHLLIGPSRILRPQKCSRTCYKRCSH